MRSPTERPLWRRTWFQSVLVLPLVAVLLWLAFRKVDFGELWAEFQEANYAWVIIGMLVGLAGLMVRTIRWQLLLDTSKVKTSFLGTFYALMAGYFGNLLVPRAGEVVRCAEVARVEKTRFDVALGTVVAERLCDMLMGVVVGILAVAISLHHFGGFVRAQIITPLMNEWTWQLGLLLLVAFIVLLVLCMAFVFALQRNVFGRRIRVRLRRLWRGLLQGVLSIWTMEKKWEFLFWTLLLWFIYWVNTYTVTLALNASSGIGFMMSLPLLAVATFGMIVPVQGGLGSFHLAVALWLEMEGLSRAEGLTYATLSHGPQLILVLVLPLLLYIPVRWRRGNRG